MFWDILETDKLGGLGAKVTEVSVKTTEGKEGEVQKESYLKIRGKIFTGTWTVASQRVVSSGERNDRVPLWSEEFAAIPTNT